MVSQLPAPFFLIGAAIENVLSCRMSMALIAQSVPSSCNCYSTLMMMKTDSRDFHSYLRIFLYDPPLVYSNFCRQAHRQRYLCSCGDSAYYTDITAWFPGTSYHHPLWFTSVTLSFLLKCSLLNTVDWGLAGSYFWCQPIWSRKITGNFWRIRCTLIR